MKKGPIYRRRGRVDTIFELTCRASPGFAGIHFIAGFGHNYQINIIWAVFVVIVSIALILQGLTGIYLWFHFHKERRIGAILLGINLLYSFGLIVLMRLA
jgi:hypothetical protein